MDAKDFAILRDIAGDPTIPLTEIGRRLGVSHTAVRTRLDKLAQSGVFRGFAALPHPSYLGLQARLHTWRDDAFDPSRIDELLEAPGVVLAFAGHAGVVAAMVYSADARAPEALTKLLGEPMSSTLPRFAAADPPRLTPAAARVLSVLVEDPRASIERIAAGANVSRKTARKHRGELLEKGAIEVMPLVVAVSEAGVILFHIHADLASLDDVRRLQEAAGAKAALLSVMHDPPGAYLFGRADSLLEVLQLESRISHAVGASLMVPTAASVASGRLHDWMASIGRPEVAP